MPSNPIYNTTWVDSLMQQRRWLSITVLNLPQFETGVILHNLTKAIIRINFLLSESVSQAEIQV